VQADRQSAVIVDVRIPRAIVLIFWPPPGMWVWVAQKIVL
jgi:hypothetical protein